MKYAIVRERKHIWSPKTWAIVDETGDVIGRYEIRDDAREDLRRIKIERAKAGERGIVIPAPKGGGA